MIEPLIKLSKAGLPRYVFKDKHRDGRPRYRFRKRGLPKRDLKGEPGSKEFWKSYAEAMAGRALTQHVNPAVMLSSKQLANPKTLSELVQAYCASGEFQIQEKLTQADKRRVFAAILNEPLVPGGDVFFRECPLASLTRAHMKVLRDRKVDKPNAANKRLIYLSTMFNWALDEEIAPLESNLASQVKRFKRATKGFHTWSEEEVAQYETRHPVGTKARLAESLFLFTGMRLSDIAQLGRQHEKKRWYVKPQWKGRRLHGKTITVPILPVLRSIIDRSEIGELTYLVTEYGVPFSIKGMGQKFKEWCRQAGLPHCSAHGLRKTGATIASNNGATDAQLKAIFNWERNQQAETYTRAINRKKLAGEAMHFIMRRADEEDKDGDDG